jgi:hypothetical protein
MKIAFCIYVELVWGPEKERATVLHSFQDLQAEFFSAWPEVAQL